MRTALIPARDATLVTALLLGAVWAGSAGLAHLDVALLGYLGATLVGVFGTTWRVSAWWRRPAAVVYARALFAALRRPRTLLRTGRTAARDLGAQRFIARRSCPRWLAHLLLSLGTLVSFAITLPLVFGWLRFEADGQQTYRAVLFGAVPAARFAVEGLLGWLVFTRSASPGWRSPSAPRRSSRSACARAASPGRATLFTRHRSSSCWSWR